MVDQGYHKENPKLVTVHAENNTFLCHCEAFRPKQSQKRTNLDCFASLARTKMRFFRERLTKLNMKRLDSCFRRNDSTRYDIRIEKFSVCKGLTRVQPYRKQISLKAEFYGQEGKLNEYLCG